MQERLFADGAAVIKTNICRSTDQGCWGGEKRCCWVEICSLIITAVQGTKLVLHINATSLLLPALCPMGNCVYLKS